MAPRNSPKLFTVKIFAPEASLLASARKSVSLGFQILPFNAWTSAASLAHGLGNLVITTISVVPPPEVPASRMPLVGPGTEKRVGFVGSSGAASAASSAPQG